MIEVEKFDAPLLQWPREPFTDHDKKSGNAADLGTDLGALTIVLIWMALQSHSQPHKENGQNAEALAAEDGIINVKQAPFHAAGDGVTDDRDAIQKAWDAATQANPSR